MANPVIVPGAFVPSTNIWDVSQIYDVDVNSEEFRELLVRLYQNINNIAITLNERDSGYYPQSSFINGQVFFPDPALLGTNIEQAIWRPVARTVVNFGALPNTASKSVVHGIVDEAGNPGLSATCSITRLYAAATDPIALQYIPIPYASPVLANNIELSMDNTNVTITTGSNRSAFTVCYVIIEYITT